MAPLGATGMGMGGQQRMTLVPVAYSQQLTGVAMQPQQPQQHVLPLPPHLQQQQGQSVQGMPQQPHHFNNNGSR
jgi:hypothetical protein